MGFSWQELDNIRSEKGWDLPIPPICERCGYNMLGQKIPQCPQCGATYSWKQLRREARQKWIKANRLKHAHKDTVAGLICGLSGIGLVVIPRFYGWEIAAAVGEILALCLGLLAVVLGYQVLSARSLPLEFVPGMQARRPPLFPGLVCICCGMLSIVLGLVF